MNDVGFTELTSSVEPTDQSFLDKLPPREIFLIISFRRMLERDKVAFLRFADALARLSGE